MFLARLQLNQNRMATLWVSNPYRVHQRLRMAYPTESRLLFRIEELPNGTTQILAQSHSAPDWSVFSDFPVLRQPPEHKLVEWALTVGKVYRFRLLANPTRKTHTPEGKAMRLSLFKSDEQKAWLQRKFQDAGAEVINHTAAPRGLQQSRKNPQKDENNQTHFAVLFEGMVRVSDVEKFKMVLKQGIGSAKGYGFGLLSLAPA